MGVCLDGTRGKRRDSSGIRMSSRRLREGDVFSNPLFGLRSPPEEQNGREGAAKERKRWVEPRAPRPDLPKTVTE